MVAKGFDVPEVEFLVLDVSGQVLEHRWIHSANGTAELDLSAHMTGSGMVLASVRAPGQKALTPKIQTVR